MVRAHPLGESLESAKEKHTLPGGFPERGLSMEEAPLSKTEDRISWKFGENKLGE